MSLPPLPQTTPVAMQHALMLLQINMSIQAMNRMYDLPVNERPVPVTDERLVQFRKILGDEFSELEDVMEIDNPDFIIRATAYADLLGDIIVYCMSEMARHGIPFTGVMQSIMESNFSKLGADGLPIKCPETGKFLKGPNYVPPEKDIENGLRSMISAESNLERAGIILPGS